MRRKSVDDIEAQSRRLQTLANSQGRGDRVDRIASIAGRYRGNINRAINPLYSMGVPMYGETSRRVPRSVYMGLRAANGKG